MPCPLLFATQRMAAVGASRPLRRIPAIVSFLNPQPALSLVGGNRSSCPTPAVRDTRRDRASLKATTDTQFLIGSVTKSFTSTGLALLMDERRIDWTKPVRDYIPEFRLHDAVATDRITTVLRRLSGERCEVGAQVAFDQPGLLPSEGAALAFGNVVSSCRYSASQGAVSAGARRQSLSPRAALPADPSAMTRRTRPHNFWTGSKRRCRAEAFSNTTGGAPRSSKRAASRHP
jgi:Beta-lactamase